jgi:hypothetical protein
MAMSFEWKVPPEIALRPEDHEFDLEVALSAIVAIRTSVPADAFTADILGTERGSNGVIIRNDGVEPGGKSRKTGGAV